MSEQAEWFQKLEDEHDNIRAVLSWALQGQTDIAMRVAGAIWLFWASDRASPGTNDIWLVQRTPVTGGWGQARQITGAAAEDNQPFAQVALNGLVWLFWRSNRSGNFDLFFKQLVTSV